MIKEKQTMKTIKKILAALLAGVMAVSLTACGGNGNSSSNASTGSSTSTSGNVDLGGAKITMSGSTSIEKFCSRINRIFQRRLQRSRNR